LIPNFSILVVTFMALSFTCLLGYGYLAVNIKSKSSVSKASTYLSKLFGSAFIVSGLALANASQK
jgi:threonine/homoserine/homoserine lactone efflux protein